MDWNVMSVGIKLKALHLDYELVVFAQNWYFYKCISKLERSIRFMISIEKKTQLPLNQKSLIKVINDQIAIQN